MRKIYVIAPTIGLLITFLVWFSGSSNPITPAGYVGYLTKDAVFGETEFYGMQTGPASPGRTWMLNVTNVSITPYTYSEEFEGEEAVVASDNMKINFRVHIVWRVREDQVQLFVEKYSTLSDDENPDNVVKIAYNNFLKERLRTYARNEIQKLKGLEIKTKIAQTGENIFKKVQQLTHNTPFDVSSVVVGNIQYPPEVSDAVARKMAMTQVKEQKATELEIEQSQKAMRIVQAEGIAEAMRIIQAKLTPQYLQHEAIEAQKAMVGSPNHTTVYIPVGPMGVPLVGTFDVQNGTNSGSSGTAQPTPQ